MIAKVLQPMCPALLLVGTLCVGVPGRGQTPETVVAGFEQRVDAVFRADAGKPLKREKKKPPLAPGRGT